MAMKCAKEVHFCAGHRLFETVPEGHKCSQLHGHNYRVIVEVEIEQTRSMVIDFAVLKRVINETVVEDFDHKMMLNEHDHDAVNVCRALCPKGVVLFRGDPTAENIAKSILSRMRSALSQHMDIPFKLSVTVYETPSSYVTMTEDTYSSLQ